MRGLVPLVYLCCYLVSMLESCFASAQVCIYNWFHINYVYRFFNHLSTRAHLFFPTPLSPSILYHVARELTFAQAPPIYPSTPIQLEPCHPSPPASCRGEPRPWPCAAAAGHGGEVAVPGGGPDDGFSAGRGRAGRHLLRQDVPWVRARGVGWQRYAALSLLFSVLFRVFCF